MRQVKHSAISNKNHSPFSIYGLMPYKSAWNLEL